MRMRVILLTIAVTLVGFAGHTSSALAQAGGVIQSFGSYGSAGSDLTYLRYEQIRNELEVSEEQWTKLQELTSEMTRATRELYSGLGHLTREERTKKYAEAREKIAKLREETTKKSENILLPHQLERIKQIRIQMSLGSTWGSSRALSSGDLAELLGITEEQKKRIATARIRADKQMREKLAKLREEATEEVLGELTPQQRAKLKKLLGEKFTWQPYGSRSTGHNRARRSSLGGVAGG